jgi:RTX calcium-binding nonapeptide repeat (4 copies)
MNRSWIRRFALALFALLLVPAAAIAGEFPEPKPVPEPRCRYLEEGPPGRRGNVLLIDYSMDVFVRREGLEIVVFNRNGGGLTQVPCEGGVPTVFSIDRLIYRPFVGAHALHLDLEQGVMAPGASREPGGDEIEIEVDFPETKPQRRSSVTVLGADGPERMRAGVTRAGRIGVNLGVLRDGPRRDADLIVRQVTPFNLKLMGGDGQDTLSSAGIGPRSFGAVTSVLLRGGGDSDHLRGGPRRDLIEGGDDGDVLYGRGGDDRLTGGEGGDLVIGGEGDDDIAGGGTEPSLDFLFGGRGRDSLNAIDGILDRLDCGPGGPDHAYIDTSDEWSRETCEKQHGPGAPR